MEMKDFNKAIESIKNNAEKLAATIHEAGMFAIAQANEHGNTGFGVRLIEALGKKHNAKSVAKWLQTFGKFGVKKGELVYKARKDINATNLEAWLVKANATPYWELTPDTITIVKYDYLTMLKGIVAKHKKASELESEGKTVVENNVAVIAEVEALLAKFQAKPELPAVANADPAVFHL
jgi:hypothetical protein